MSKECVQFIFPLTLNNSQWHHLYHTQNLHTCFEKFGPQQNNTKKSVRYITFNGPFASNEPSFRCRQPQITIDQPQGREVDGERKGCGSGSILFIRQTGDGWTRGMSTRRRGLDIESFSFPIAEMCFFCSFSTTTSCRCSAIFFSIYGQVSSPQKIDFVSGDEGKMAKRKWINIYMNRIFPQFLDGWLVRRAREFHQDSVTLNGGQGGG